MSRYRQQNLPADLRGLGDLENVSDDYRQSILSSLNNKTQSNAKKYDNLRFERLKRGAFFGTLLLCLLFIKTTQHSIVILAEIINILVTFFLWRNDLTVRRIFIASHIAALGVIWQEKWLVRKGVLIQLPHIWNHTSSWWMADVDRALKSPFVNYLSIVLLLIQVSFIARGAVSSSSQPLLSATFSGVMLAIFQLLLFRNNVEFGYAAYDESFFESYLLPQLTAWYFIGALSPWLQARASKSEGISIITSGLIWSLVVFVPLFIAARIAGVE